MKAVVVTIVGEVEVQAEAEAKIKIKIETEHDKIQIKYYLSKLIRYVLV